MSKYIRRYKPIGNGFYEDIETGKRIVDSEKLKEIKKKEGIIEPKFLGEIKYQAM